MAGVELRRADGSPATDLAMGAVKEMLRRGFIVLPEGEHGNVISFTPPLTITRAGARGRRPSLAGGPLVILSEMKGVLAQRGWMLTKSLGQNFLHDQNQLRRILAAAELTPQDKVLEIGPGLGPLTELLVEKCGEVLAIEKDQRLFGYLAEKLSSQSNLKLLCADALDYLKTERDWNDWKLVSNLPYSVALDDPGGAG